MKIKHENKKKISLKAAPCIKTIDKFIALEN